MTQVIADRSAGIAMRLVTGKLMPGMISSRLEKKMKKNRVARYVEYLTPSGPITSIAILSLTKR
jgi:hypothetical protein